MARLIFENKTETIDIPQIQRALGPLGIKVAYYEISQDVEIQQLLNKDLLTDEEKEQVLVGHDIYFTKLQQVDGYQMRDLVVLCNSIEGLEGMLSKFDKCHTHEDDEVRYIVDGKGWFGFVMPDGQQAKLLVEAGEYINIPKDTEHWFVLDDDNWIKAIRYFSNTDGWAPKYTGTEVKL